MMPTNDFIVTKEHKRFMEFCNACQKEKYIGLCHGDAGIGKSMSARYFSKWNQISSDIHNCFHMLSDTFPSIDMSALNTIIYTPEVVNSARSVKDDTEHLMHAFNRLKEKSLYKNGVPFDVRKKNYVEILIVDEADRMMPKSLEQLRAFYDRHDIAMILIGMPGIEKRLIRFPQLYSRIGFSHTFKPLCEEEVIFIIQNRHNSLNVSIDPEVFGDKEAIATIARITQGNFRLIDRLLKQTQRIMEVNNLSSLSKEVVEAARECLIIGNIY